MATSSQLQEGYVFHKGVMMTNADAKQARDQDTKIDKALVNVKGLRQLVFEKISGTEYDQELKRRERAVSDIWPKKDYRTQKDLGIKEHKDILIRAHKTLPEDKQLTSHSFLKVKPGAVAKAYNHAFNVRDLSHISHANIEQSKTDMINRFIASGNTIPKYELWGDWKYFGWCIMAHHLFPDPAELQRRTYDQHTVCLIKDTENDYSHFIQLDDETDAWEVQENHCSSLVKAHSPDTGENVPLRSKFVRKYGEAAHLHSAHSDLRVWHTPGAMLSTDVYAPI
jgi:hypothetical protein